MKKLEPRHIMTIVWIALAVGAVTALIGVFYGLSVLFYIGFGTLAAAVVFKAAPHNSGARDLRADLSSQKGIFSQEYFVYFKKK